MGPSTGGLRVLAAVSTGALALAVGGAGTAVARTAAARASAASASTAVLNIGYASDPAPTGFDPLEYSSGQRLFYEALYNSLFVEGKGGASVPSLVSSDSMNSAHTVLTLQLRKGVKFSDGTPVDGAAVVANLDRRNDKKLVAYAGFETGGSTAISSVKATSPYTVMITFASAQTSAVADLTGVPGMIVNPKDFNKLGTAPAGSGPYTLQSAVRGSSYTLVRNRDAWSASKYVYQTLTYKVITSDQALANALVSGQVDEATLADGTTESFLKREHVGVTSVAGAEVLLMDLDIQGQIDPTFGNLDNREAINLAINREALVKGPDKGDTATLSAFPKGDPGYDASLNKQWAYNPTQAKADLASAGNPSGFSFSTVITPPMQTDMEAIQAQLAKVGITMNLTTTTSTAAIFGAINTEPLAWFNPSWPPDPFGLVAGVFVGGFANPHKESNPAVGAAFGAAASATGSAETAALKTLNDALVDQGWLFPLYQQETYVGYNKHLVKTPTFSGSDPYPLLASLKPAS